MYALLSGVQVHYEILGAGDPNMLVHGWGGSSESISPLAKILSTTHKVILIDHQDLVKVKCQILVGSRGVR